MGEPMVNKIARKKTYTFIGPIFLQTIPIPVQAQKIWSWIGHWNWSFFQRCLCIVTFIRLEHTASKWTFTKKKCNGNFDHSSKSYMPSGSQNRFWINPWRPSGREIGIWNSILFSDTSIFQLENMDTKTFLMSPILILFFFWERRYF